MTPDLLEQGARRVEQRMAAMASASPATESGGRNASTGRIAKPEGEVDLTHGRILYLEDVSVSFDGFKAINKLSIWVISAVMCGVAGALYVPQVGIINPGEMSPANSIEIAIWAAVGGRASLIGPIVGAFIVNGAKSWLTVAYPEFWLYFLGTLFIAVTLFLPNGVVGLLKNWRAAK